MRPPLHSSLDSVRRKRADSAFAKVFAFDSEGVVVAGAVVLPSDARGELDQLGVGEFLTQAGEESVGDFHRGLRHRVRVFEHEPLQVGEARIRAVARQIRNLLGGDAVHSADGRADVDSKRTTDKGRYSKLGQTFQFAIDELAAGLGLLHLAVSPEDCGMMRRYLHGHDEATETAFGQ